MAFVRAALAPRLAHRSASPLCADFVANNSRKISAEQFGTFATISANSRREQVQQNVR
jgi:hypothetical protein